MYSKFNNLSKEKKEIIINSAIEEFAQNGFHKASTDKIANNANIAKGSLFHYFKNKKNLYLYIVRLCIDFISGKIKDKADNINSNDFYERLKLISIFKQNIFITYPLYTKVSLDAFTSPAEEIKEEIQALTSAYHCEGIKFMEDYIVKYMNEEYLKEEVDTKDALFITTTIFEALSNKYLSMYKSAVNLDDVCTDEIFKEFDRYIDILKYGLYKK